LNKRIATLLPVMLGALLLAAVSGCTPDKEDSSPKKPEGKVIARVGQAYLTLEELKASIPSEYADIITREQNILYVRQWINTELLYQEALRQGVDKEHDIRARLEKMRRDLLSAEIISRSVRGGADVGEVAIKEYYETNREQFVREAFTVRYEEIVVDELTLAWELRRNATHETFHSLANTHSKFRSASAAEGNVNPPYVPLDAIPPVIRTAIMAASVPSITGPYRAEDGFHILRLVGRFDKGTIASLDEVREEIVSRLSNITQKGETDRLISDVRSRSDVEFNEDLVPGIGGSAGGGIVDVHAPEVAHD